MIIIPLWLIITIIYIVLIFFIFKKSSESRSFAYPIIAFSLTSLLTIAYMFYWIIQLVFFLIKRG